MKTESAVAAAAAGAPTISRRRRRPSLARSRWTAISVVTLLALLLAWWLATRFELVSHQHLPTPSHLGATYRDLVSRGYQGSTLQEHIWTSLRRCLLGFAIGASVGLVLGLLSGFYRGVSAVVTPIVALFRPVPPIAYLPLLVTFLGIDERPKIFLIATGAFFYMLLNTSSGVRGVSESLIQTGRMLGLSRRQLFSSVVFRAALPQILVGVNVSLVLSWAVVVAAELVSSSEGLGFLAVDAATYYRLDVVYAAVILIGVIGALFEFAVRLLERYLVPWVGK